MKTLIRILLVVALVGLLWAAVIHISTLAGTAALFGNSLRFLGPTLFVVWVPAIFVMNRLTRAFRNCWIKYSTRLKSARVGIGFTNRQSRVLCVRGRNWPVTRQHHSDSMEATMSAKRLPPTTM